MIACAVFVLMAAIQTESRPSGECIEKHVLRVGRVGSEVQYPVSKEPMKILETVLLSILIVFPLLDLVLEKYRFKNKISEYLKASFLLWAVTAFLMYAFSMGALGVSAPDDISSSALLNITALLAILAFVVFMAYSAVSISTNRDVQARVSSAIQSGRDSMNELLPATRREYLIFVLIVSVSAGICEELLFRWYLLAWLELHANWLLASVISSLVFGLWHLYLGWIHVIKSAAVGFLLCLLYLYFESIVFVIVLHILMDVHAGTVAFLARKPVKDVD